MVNSTIKQQSASSTKLLKMESPTKLCNLFLLKKQKQKQIVQLTFISSLDGDGPQGHNNQTLLTRRKISNPLSNHIFSMLIATYDWMMLMIWTSKTPCFYLKNQSCLSIHFHFHFQLDKVQKGFDSDSSKPTSSCFLHRMFIFFFPPAIRLGSKLCGTCHILTCFDISVSCSHVYT